MGDDYQVIARSVRRPMQRWWQRVGVWWVALIVLLLLAIAVAAYLGYGWQHGGLSRFRNWSLFRGMLDLAWYFIFPLAGALWLQAAWRVLAALEDLTAGSLIMTGDLRSTLIRFRLVLAQTVWPLAFIAASYVLIGIRGSLETLGDEYWSSVTCLSNLYRAGEVLLDLVLFLWIAALLALKPMPRVVVWLWWIACFAAGPLSRLFQHSYINVYFKIPSIPMPANYEVAPYLAATMSLAGLALIALAVYLIATGRAAGVWLGIALGILGVFNALRIGAASDEPGMQVAWRAFADYVINSLHYLSAWRSLFWAQSLADGDQPLLRLYWPGYAVNVECSLWWQWVSLPFQALIAYGYYWFIRWLLVLGASRRAASSA